MKKNNFRTSITAPIEVSDHAIQRFKLRRQQQDMSNLEVVKKIINQVRQSKLIQIDGNMEHRIHKGFVYLIRREFRKDAIGLLHEKVIVVTMLLSKLRLKEMFSDDFSIESVDFAKVNRTVS